MKLEIEQIKNRKFFKLYEWNVYELSQLSNLLSEFDFNNVLISNIKRFKQYKLKNWKTRYSRIRKKPNISTKYTRLLRYGKNDTLVWHEMYINNLKHYFSKEYLIIKHGIVLGEQKHRNRSNQFRNSDIQRQNSLKCIEKKQTNPELYNDILTTQIKYYLKHGYSEEESKLLLKDRQATFSLEKCVAKHGLEEGTQIFNERQIKWQNTLKNKSPEEINEINMRKNACIIRNNENKEEFNNRLINIGNNIIFDNDDLMEYIFKCKKNIKWKYLTKAEFISQLPYIGNATININTAIANANFIFPTHNLVKKNNKGYTYLKVSEGMLRSFFEIEFYEGLKERNIIFKLDTRYNNNSNLRYDFYLVEYDIYVEIAGSMHNIEYVDKMNYKNIIFGAFILEPNDIQDFLKRIDNNEFKKINSNI